MHTFQNIEQWKKITKKKEKKENCNLYAVCNKDLKAFSIHIYYML